MPVSLRTYRPGDETALVATWKEAHTGYGGFVPRTVRHWCWNILERPGVSAEDVQIFEREDGTIGGYGVLGASGQVLEFTIVETEPVAREAIATSLADALERRARLRGFDTLEFGLPNTDEPVCRGLRKLGYRMEPSDSLQLLIVDLPGLIRAILQQRKAELASGWSPSILLRVAPGHYRFCPHHSLLISIGPPISVAVDPAETSADCSISMDLSVLAEMVFRQSTVQDVLNNGRVKVEPSSAMSDATKFLSLIVLRSDWYSPTADGR